MRLEVRHFDIVSAGKGGGPDATTNLSHPRNTLYAKNYLTTENPSLFDEFW